MVNNIMSSFIAEEGYNPPKNTGGKYHFQIRTITRISLLNLLKNPYLTLLLASGIIANTLTQILIASVVTQWWFIISIPLSVMFVVWLTEILIKVDRGLVTKNVEPSIKMIDGWYDDPWGYGEVGRLRFFSNNKWTDNIRNSSPEDFKPL